MENELLLPEKSKPLKKLMLWGIAQVLSNLLQILLCDMMSGYYHPGFISRNSRTVSLRTTFRVSQSVVRCNLIINTEVKF